MTKTELLDQLTDQINAFQDEVDLVCEALEEMDESFQKAFLDNGACDYWLNEDDFDEYLWECVEVMIPRSDKRANKVIEDFFITYFDFEQFKRDCLIDDYYRASNGVFLRAYY